MTDWIIYIIIALAAVLLIILVLILMMKRKNRRRASDITGSGGVDLSDDLLKTNRDWTGKKGYHTGTLLVQGGNSRIKICICNCCDGSEDIRYVKGRLLIGRKPSDDVYDPNAYFIKNDSMASGVHCSLINMGGSLMLEDLGSTNHTYLNGVQADGRIYINSGDSIRIGQTTLKIQILK
ncbi:MAG: FHA domain-containing protein [Oscillospiraceae bacterium]